jgi:hypothetical protein
MPVAHGAAGRVPDERRSLSDDDANAARRFRGRSRTGAAFAVAQLLNKRDGPPFEGSDEVRFAEFARGVAPVLEGWVRMSNAEARRAELMRSAREESP